MKLRMTFVILAVLCVFCAVVFADSLPKVTAVSGQPKIMKKDSGAWTVCVPAAVVDSGDRIKTGSGEAVDIMFLADKANIISVTENSDVVVVKSGDPCSLELINGEILALMSKIPKGSSFEIKTPAGISGARGTGWGSATDGKKATFDSYERSIYVKGVDQAGNAIAGELTVEEGFRAVVDRFEKPERLEKLTSNDMDRWNNWKEGAASRAAEAQKAMAGTSGAAGSQQPGDSNRSRLDKISKEENQIESLENKKQDISETRDIQTINERQEAPASREPEPPNRDGEKSITRE